MSRSSDYIPAPIRMQVAKRAGFQCEYCLVPDSRTFSFYKHQVDHIISLKHRGTNSIDNLAYACFAFSLVNVSKGPDVGSIHDETGQFVGFYNPRTDIWAEHFQFHLFRIAPLTAIGWVTAIILQFNTEERIASRRIID